MIGCMNTVDAPLSAAVTEAHPGLALLLADLDRLDLILGATDLA